MREKLVSIVIPSRDRHDIIENTFYSYGKLAYDISSFSMIVILDDDDQESIDHLNVIKERCGYEMNIHTRKRSEYLMRDYYSFGFSKMEKGKQYWRWQLGNDTPVITPQWDKVLRENTEQHFDAIDNQNGKFYLHINDSTLPPHTSLGCCFPIVSDNFEKAGPDDQRGWGSDTILYKSVEPEFRFDLRDKLAVDHISAHTGKYWSDNVAHSVAKRTDGSFQEILEGKWTTLNPPDEWKITKNWRENL